MQKLKRIVIKNKSTGEKVDYEILEASYEEEGCNKKCNCHFEKCPKVKRCCCWLCKVFFRLPHFMLLLMGGAFLWFGYSLISENSPTTVELKLENSTKLLKELQDEIKTILSEEGDVVKLKGKIKSVKDQVESLEREVGSITNVVNSLKSNRYVKKEGDGV